MRVEEIHKFLCSIPLIGNMKHCLEFLSNYKIDGVFIASALHYNYFDITRDNL